jgi:septum formation protein
VGGPTKIGLVANSDDVDCNGSGKGMQKQIYECRPAAYRRSLSLLSDYLVLYSSAMKVELVLASASPRRRELIQMLGFPFTVRAADVDEESVMEPDAAANARQTAALKAEAVVGTLLAGAERQRFETAYVVAADTTVAVDGRMLAKPAGEQEAWQMLRLLRGRGHQVYTGITLVYPATGRTIQDVAATAVTMRDYSDAEIAAYVATGDPMDKAGAYAIQHRQFRPVATLDGCYANVVGLPLCHLACALQKMGVALPLKRPTVCPPNVGLCPFYPTLFEKYRESC